MKYAAHARGWTRFGGICSSMRKSAFSIWKLSEDARARARRLALGGSVKAAFIAAL